jgi:hypothetical protein
MERDLSWSDWLNRPRASLPRPVKGGLVAAILISFGFGAGLWLTHSGPTVTLVVGTPIAVSIDGGRTARDPAFVSKLVHELNALPPEPLDAVTTCSFPAGKLQYDLRFEYDDGDRLTVTVHNACGRTTVGGAYARGLLARGSQTLFDDLNNWPVPPGP